MIDKITQDLLQDNLIKESLPLKELIESNSISIENLIIFIAKKIKNGEYELSIIKEYNYIKEGDILKYLALEMNLLFQDLDMIDIDLELANKVPSAQLQKYNALPLFQDDSHIIIAVNDPLDIDLQESFQRIFSNKPIKLALSTKKQINRYLAKIELQESVKELVKKIKDELNSLNSMSIKQDVSSILLLIDLILKTCINARASDIHIEPTEKNCSIRARIDGKLTEIFIFDKTIYLPLSSRIKLLANIDIAEKRKPQDGRFSTTIEKKEYDFRVSSLPILYGESIVMRILDKQKALVKLQDAGMDQQSYNKLLKALHTPHGIILVTGPTGSGKTTTLYGALNELRNIEDKVITVEDPIEYRMNLIQQVQVNPKVGLSFADALRSILRQDPDKIMIGEIRDKETLEIATKAALTGHMVISTLHTNDAISAITRMVDMGIEHYLISGALVVVQAQRLIRKLCIHCKEEMILSSSTLKDYQKYIPSDAKFYTAKGCKECNNTGFIGREMICEVLEITDKLSSLIAQGVSKDKLLQQAYKDGFINIFENGINKAISGITSLQEVLKVAKVQ
jgi:general secretion pathway protein E